MTIAEKARRVAMIVAPIGLIAFSLSHGTLSWSETQHLQSAGVDGAFEALFFAPSAIDWLDQGASYALRIGAVAAALALWRDYGWRVSVPLALAGYVLARSDFPPYGAIAGLALGLAAWQYLVLTPRAGRRPSPPSPSTT